MKKKVLATLVAGSFLLAGVGCDDKDATPTTTAATTVAESSDTEATDDSETTTSEEETEVSTQETEYDLLNGQIYACKYSKVELDKIYTMYKAKAKEIADASGKSGLFGYFLNEIHEPEYCFEYVLAYYDDSNDALTLYHEVDGEIVEFEGPILDIGSKEVTVENAKKVMMPYDTFASYPGLSNFDYMGDSMIAGEFDNGIYNGGLSDGYYGGTLFGISKDADCIYAALGANPDLDISVDDLLALKPGDTVDINGETYNVQVVEELPKYNLTEIDISNPENGDFYGIDIYNDETPRIISFDNGTYTGYEDGKFVKMPIAENCVIDLLVAGSEFETYDLAGYKDYLSTADSHDFELISYQDGGYGVITFEATRNMPFYGVIYNLKVSDGKIVYMCYMVN